MQPTSSISSTHKKTAWASLSQKELLECSRKTKMMDHLSSLEKTASTIHPKTKISPSQLEMPLILWPTNTPKNVKPQTTQAVTEQSWTWQSRITGKLKQKWLSFTQTTTTTICKYLGKTTMFRWKKEQAQSTDGRRWFSQMRFGQHNGWKTIEDDHEYLYYLYPIYSYFFTFINCWRKYVCEWCFIQS